MKKIVINHEELVIFHIRILTPCNFNCYIFFVMADSFGSIWFFVNLIVFKYFPIFDLLSYFTKLEDILFPDKSSVFTKLLETKLKIFLASLLLIYNSETTIYRI